MNGFLFLAPSLGLFFFCLFCAMPMDGVFVFILLYFILLLSLRSLFSNESQKGSRCRWDLGGGKELGEAEGGEDISGYIM